MAKSPLIKQANVDDTLTPEQEIEVIKCAKDPMYFMRNYMRVQHPTRGAVLFDLYPYQERIIQSIIENDKTIILAPRQCGKCCTSSTLVNIRNKTTGKVETITLGELYEKCKGNRKE